LLFVHGDTHRIPENSVHVPVLDYVSWIGELVAPAAAETAASAAAARPLRARLGLVDLQGAALEVLAVQR
jgi:hypothetical protein